LQHLALNRGLQRKTRLWSEAGQKALRELPLEGWAACRREDLLRLRTVLDEQIGQLDEAVKHAADGNQQARLLMTQPGVGPITSLAFVLTIGDVARFKRVIQVVDNLCIQTTDIVAESFQRDFIRTQPESVLIAEIASANIAGSIDL
jgi:transposase